jgi:glycerol-3-phosphate acyltransferase PlsY
MQAPALAVPAAYMVGSIPWAYLAGRLFKGVDLRTVGSGNLGTTNVLRVLGLPAAAVVFALDAAKGAVPVAVFPAAFGFEPRQGWAILCALAAILGHVRPVFLLWQGGGKGVATGTGAFFALTPVAISIAFVGFLAVLLATRIMSAASLTGTALFPVAVGATSGIRSPLFAVSVGVAAFVFWTHRENIARLRRGEEPRIGKGAQP